MPATSSASPGGTAALLLLAPDRDPGHLAQALAGAGWTVSVAASPREALAASAIVDFALVVVDAALPDLSSGLHPAVALLRGCPTDRAPRLVLVTDHVDERVTALAAAAGAYRIVPLGPARPPTAHATQSPAATPPMAEPLPGRDGRGRDPRVWIVDDAPAIRLLAGRAFERAGWMASEFPDLHSADLALAAGERPDAVLLDIFLPDGNGLDAATRFVVAGAAVVMMSNLAGPDQVERAFAAGAADIVAKPVDMRSLVARVRRAVGWADHSVPADAAATAAPPSVEDRSLADALRF